MERRPRRAEGQARIGCSLYGPGPEGPAHSLTRAEEEGACPFAGRSPSPGGLKPPGLESPPRPAGVERGHVGAVPHQTARRVTTSFFNFHRRDAAEEEEL